METKEITDPNSIFKMIETLYKQFPVYTLINKKPLQVKVLAIKNNSILIQSPENITPAERFLFLTNAGNLLQFKFTVVTKDPRGIELLQPTSLFIKNATRTNDRYQVAKVPIYLSNIISQTMIPHDLADDTMKIEALAKPYIQKLKGKFSEVSFFIHERMDTRMRLLADSGKHLFVPDSKAPESVTENFIPFNEYIHLVKQNKELNKYLSEICIPLKYKNIVLFGYIQILNLEKTNINDYNLVLHAVNKFCDEIAESDIFNESKMKCSVMDISSNGLSFSHPQSKHFGKLFSIGGTILFNIYEENVNLGTFRAVVRNIKPLEKLFRIGCQFFHTFEEHAIIENLIKKHFPESLKEEQSQIAANADKPKTQIDSVLDSLSEDVTDPNIKGLSEEK